MLFRFWRWLTCGHGHHRWQIRTGIYIDGSGGVIAVRYCPRCVVVEVLE